MAEPNETAEATPSSRGRADDEPVIRVRRIHRRDLNRVWEFLKLVFRDVNRETVEYQRPRSKKRFLEVYEEEGVEQLLFEVADGAKTEIVGYAECAFEITGSDNWMNERYFSKHDMRPLFVEELAVHTGYQGRGIGGFLLEQLEHLARVRGCTHLVLEVAENNMHALSFYKTRSFYKLDAAIFMAKKVAAEDELLPPRRLKKGRSSAASPKARGKRKTEPPPKKAAEKKAAEKKAPEKKAAEKKAPEKKAAEKKAPAARPRRVAIPVTPAAVAPALAVVGEALSGEDTLNGGELAELSSRPSALKRD
jgi:ribosomal protein S18 acetylase RimI-like enzyme